MERGLIHISTGWDTPRPRTPTPHYRHLFERGRGGLTTNGIHSILPLGLSNRPGPPPRKGWNHLGVNVKARNPHIDAPLSVESVEVIVRYEPGV